MYLVVLAIISDKDPNKVNYIRKTNTAKENAQQYGVDHDGTFSHVARMDTIRVPSELYFPLQHKISDMLIKWM